MKALVTTLAMLVMLTGISAHAKVSKKDREAAEAACKAEKPDMNKKEMKKCVAEHLKKH